MVFKLVRTDTVEPFKIQVLPGSYLLGRGKFLECEDKRVSRNHGELKVTEDCVTIKALHQNPCFFIKKGAMDTQILKFNETIELNNGDQFGLLPDTYWYEIIHCILPDVVIDLSEECGEKQAEPLINKMIEEQVSTSPQSAENAGGIVLTSDTENHNIENKMENSNINGNGSAERAESPSLLPPEIAEAFTQGYTLELDDISVAPTNESQGNQQKRSLSHNDINNDNIIIKRAKTEPVDSNCIKQEPPDNRPGTSTDQGISKDKDTSDKTDLNDAPKQNIPCRERCVYGANCYRKNPQHKAQFSHPCDTDWGSGERGVCPYGARCRRRDPRHWQHHDHPPGTVPPPPNIPGESKKPPKRRRRITMKDSPRTDLILTGKRARNTIKRPSWSGSESENEYDMDDPFLTDGSDEWAPSSDEMESQDYSRSTQNIDDDDDQ